MNRQTAFFRRLRKALRTLVVPVAGLLTACATAVTVRPTGDLDRDLTTLVSRFCKKSGSPAAGVYYVSPGGQSSAGFWGAAPEEVFEIGSATKMFVAVTVLQLAEEGLLSLEDPVSRFGFDFPRADTITLRNLLDHTAGMPDYTATPGLFDDPEALLIERSPEELLALGLAAPVPETEGWFYSNTHYILLGMIIERATGHPPEQEIRRRILGPLGMTHTFYRPTEPVTLPYVSGYFLTDSGTPWGGWNGVHPSLLGCSGGMVSTAGDLALFLAALFDGRLLRPESLDAMTALTPRPGGIRYGLGLFSWELAGRWLTGHGGSAFGVKCGVYRYDDDGSILICYTALGNEPALVPLEKGLGKLLEFYR